MPHYQSTVAQKLCHGLEKTLSSAEEGEPVTFCITSTMAGRTTCLSSLAYRETMPHSIKVQGRQGKGSEGDDKREVPRNYQVGTQME